MEYNPSVWGPHYWFFLHSVGFTYPEMPTDGEKKKYYNLIISLPTFIPNNAAANNFQRLIDDYPVSSYLNSKNSFLKWIHFIHNKINEPERTGIKIKIGDAFSKTPNKATAPAGGCKHRKA